MIVDTWPPISDCSRRCSSAVTAATTTSEIVYGTANGAARLKAASALAPSDTYVA